MRPINHIHYVFFCVDLVPYCSTLDFDSEREIRAFSFNFKVYTPIWKPHRTCTSFHA